MVRDEDSGEALMAQSRAANRREGFQSRPSRVAAPAQADVLTLLGIFLRRWYLVVPGLVLAGAAAYFVNESVAPEYEADGTLMLTMPADGAEAGAEEDDPVDSGEAADAAGAGASGRVIAEVVQGDQVRLELMEQGLAADYTVRYEDSGSLLRVEAVSTDEVEVVATAESVIEALEDELTRRQSASGADGDERWSIEVLSQPAVAVPQPVEEGEPTRYQARGVVALVPEIVEGTQTSPFRPDRATAQILVNIMNGDAMSERLLEGEPEEASYRVRQDRQDAAPFLYIQATGVDPEQTLQLFSDTRAALEAELEVRQESAGADPETWVIAETISAPLSATSLGGEGLRAALTVFALVAGLTFGLVLLGETISNARRRRRETDPRFPLLYADTGTTGSSRTELEGSR